MESSKPSTLIIDTLINSTYHSYLVQVVTKKAHYLTDLTVRSLVRQEIVNNMPYVRLYQTIFAPSNKSHKDIKQTSDGRIEFNKIKINWVNMGQPYRALEFLKKYLLQSGDKNPAIRSILIPSEVYNNITSYTISENQKKFFGDYSLNCDKTQASDQYGLNINDMKIISQNTLRGSLITYVPDEKISDFTRNHPNSGKIVGLSEMFAELGLPDNFLSLPTFTEEYSDEHLSYLSELMILTKKITNESIKENDINKMFLMKIINKNFASKEFIIYNKRILLEKINLMITVTSIPFVLKKNYEEAMLNINMFPKQNLNPLKMQNLHEKKHNNNNIQYQEDQENNDIANLFRLYN
jgi:hypothetical protein